LLPGVCCPPVTVPPKAGQGLPDTAVCRRREPAAVRGGEAGAAQPAAGRRQAGARGDVREIRVIQVNSSRNIFCQGDGGRSFYL